MSAPHARQWLVQIPWSRQAHAQQESLLPEESKHLRVLSSPKPEAFSLHPVKGISQGYT